jgi:hypothetical protein
MRIIRKIASKVFEFMVFLLMLFFANYFKKYITYPIYIQIVDFINANLYFSVIIALVFLFSDIFYLIMFPFSLPAPLFSAAGAILLIIYIKRMFILIDQLTSTNVSIVFQVLSYLIYPVVIIIVLISGYARIFFSLFTPKQQQRTDKKERIIDVKKVKDWEEIGKEFKQAFSDFFNTLKNSIFGK